MKPIVLYSSPTGVTKNIAEAVVKALPKHTPCLSVSEVPKELEAYDCVFLGFCMSHGVADEASQQVFNILGNGQHVAVFITVDGDIYSDDASKGLHGIIECLPKGIHVDGTYITSLEEYTTMTAEEHHNHLRFVSDFAKNTYERMQA